MKGYVKMRKAMVTAVSTALLAAMFCGNASALTVENVSYNVQTKELTVAGKSDKNVNIVLLKAGCGISSLNAVSNENNPFLSINVAKPAEDGSFEYTFTKELSEEENHVLMVNDGTTAAAEQYVEVLGDNRVIYVDQDKGGDNYAGTSDYPLKTIEGAKAKVKAMRAENPVGNIEVIVREGTYSVTSPIKFEAEDSGSADGKVIYRADGKVIFSGAAEISGFKSVTDSDILNRLPASARDKVKVADTSSINQELFKMQYQPSWQITVPTELYFNGKKQTLAKWPNDGYANYEYQDGKIKLSSAKAARWADAENAYIRGYLDNAYYREAHKFSIKDNLLEPSGVTLRADGKYEIINLPEELDMPGEWYADTKNKKLYFYPPKEITRKDTVEYISYTDSFIKLDGASYIEFDGFEFKNSGVKNADVDQYAVYAENASNVKFKNITVDNCVGSGIYLSGTNCEISNCMVYNMGGKGISLGGGDVKSLTPGNSIASDNYTYSLSEYKSPHSSGNSIFGVGNTMTNNVFCTSAGTLLGFSGTDCRITNNEFYNGTIETKDSGLVYHQGEFIRYGNLFEYNYFHDCIRPNDATTGATAMNNALYWDNLLSGQTAKHNIFKIDDTENRALLASGRDNVFSENTVIGGSEVSMTDWTTYCWSIQNGKPVHQEEGTLCSFAEVGFKSLKEVDHASEPWLSTFPKVHQIYTDLVAETDSEGNPTRYNLFIPKGNENNSNVLINTNSILADGVVAENTGNAEYSGNHIFGDVSDYTYNKPLREKALANNMVRSRLAETQYKSMFVDFDKQDLRLTDEACREYGLPAGVLSESNFDISDIGAKTAKSVTNTAFDLIYPKNGAPLNAGDVTLKWSKADFADKYRYVVCKDEAMTQIAAEGETFSDTVVIEGLDKNATYYWGVWAQNTSRQNACEWSASSTGSFKTDGFDVFVRSVEFKQSSDGFTINAELDSGAAVGKAKAFVALYGEDDSLKKVLTKEIDIAAGDAIYEISDSFGIADLTKYKVWMYIWDKDGKQQPIIYKTEIKK